MISAAGSPATVLDVFVGGFLDKYTGLVILYRQAFARRHPERDTRYFEHSQRRQIIAAVCAARAANPQLVVNLIGHSWGAATAVKAANELARVGNAANLLITVDPVGRRKLGVNAPGTRWINVNAAPATSNGWDGDHYASLGGKWGTWPAECNAWHCNAPYHHNEFTTLFEYAPVGEHSALSHLLRSCEPRLN